MRSSPLLLDGYRFDKEEVNVTGRDNRQGLLHSLESGLSNVKICASFAESYTHLGYPFASHRALFFNENYSDMCDMYGLGEVPKDVSQT